MDWSPSPGNTLSLVQRLNDMHHLPHEPDAQEGKENELIDQINYVYQLMFFIFLRNVLLILNGCMKKKFVRRQLKRVKHFYFVLVNKETVIQTVHTDIIILCIKTEITFIIHSYFS